MTGKAVEQPQPVGAGGAAAAVTFAMDDLALFSRASRDRNPLHLSADYARKTAYGEPVVFGALGALACLGRLSRRPETAPSLLVVEFVQPMFPGVGYVIEVLEDSAKLARVMLRDGRRVLLGLDLIREGPRLSEPESPARRIETSGSVSQGRVSELAEAFERPPEELVAGLGLAGDWSPDGSALPSLLDRYRLASDDGAGTMTAALALLWASYLVGMQLPGRRALFSRLSLQLQPGCGPVLATHGAGQDGSLAGRFGYTATVRDFHAGFGLMTAAVALRRSGAGPETPAQAIAAGELRSFVRQDPARPTAAQWQDLCPPGDSLQGKVVLVIGASRGLGAAIAEAACRQGGTVVATYAYSREEAEALSQRAAGTPGRLVLEQGDARDPAWCADLHERLLRDYGRLDVLVCNACPALLPAWVEPATVSRIQQHVADSLALVLVPLAQSLPALVAVRGRVVLISSAAVAHPVADWPHYVAAKCALEGLARVAALEHPDVRFLIVRPPRLATDLTNTPLGRQNAIAPVRVASALVRRLSGIDGDTALSQVDYLEEF